MSDRISPRSVVLVTGASAGMGEEITLQLADRGCRLALAARGKEALDAVAHACPARGAEALAIPTGVADEAACRAFVAEAREAFGRIDVLVNNAGVSMWWRFDELESLDALRTIMDVNYFGALASVTYVRA